MEFISKSENETKEIARKVFEKLSPGNIFVLKGDLGSGKTTFVKAFAKEAGVEKEVTSPTFVLLKEYPLRKNVNGTKFLVHVDCYRMASEDDAQTVGLPEYFERKDVIMLIEWPNNISKIIPEKAISLEFEFVDENTRKITIEDGYDIDY